MEQAPPLLPSPPATAAELGPPRLHDDEDLSVATPPGTDNLSDLIAFHKQYEDNQQWVTSPRDNDIVCTQGGGNSSPKKIPHQIYLNKAYKYHLKHKKAKKQTKVQHAIRNRLIRWVYFIRKGRFLTKTKINEDGKPVKDDQNKVVKGRLRVMTLNEVKTKISTTLREGRKKYASAIPPTVINVESQRPNNETDVALVASMLPNGIGSVTDQNVATDTLHNSIGMKSAFQNDDEHLGNVCLPCHMNGYAFDQTLPMWQHDVVQPIDFDNGIFPNIGTAFGNDNEGSYKKKDDHVKWYDPSTFDDAFDTSIGVATLNGYSNGESNKFTDSYGSFHDPDSLNNGGSTIDQRSFYNMDGIDYVDSETTTTLHPSDRRFDIPIADTQSDIATWIESNVEVNEAKDDFDLSSDSLPSIDVITMSCLCGLCTTTESVLKHDDDFVDV